MIQTIMAARGDEHQITLTSKDCTSEKNTIDNTEERNNCLTNKEAQTFQQLILLALLNNYFTITLTNVKAINGLIHFDIARLSCEEDSIDVDEIVNNHLNCMMKTNSITNAKVIERRKKVKKQNESINLFVDILNMKRFNIVTKTNYKNYIFVEMIKANNFFISSDNISKVGKKMNDHFIHNYSSKQLTFEKCDDLLNTFIDEYYI